MKITNFNVVFLTIDSLSFTTAASVEGLYLNKISSFQKAETHGTYTYPAHQSFFMGMLPRLSDPDSYYLGKYKQIWRSSLSRKSNKVVAIPFNGPNILNFYKKKGHQVLGFGGVTYFDTTTKSNSLPLLFDKFVYCGPYKRTKKTRPFPRKKEWFPLLKPERIVAEITQEPYFLFINSIATHVPYDNPDSDVTPKDKALMARLFKEHADKIPHQSKSLPFTLSEHARLVDMQKKSLIWVDKQLKTLLTNLPRSRPTIFIACADHGEEFGEGGRYGHAHVHPAVMNVPYWDGILPPSNKNSKKQP